MEGCAMSELMDFSLACVMMGVIFWVSTLKG
jgi:hypothetical protein